MPIELKPKVWTVIENHEVLGEVHRVRGGFRAFVWGSREMRPLEVYPTLEEAAARVDRWRWAVEA